jgi:hypothetical protein
MNSLMGSIRRQAPAGIRSRARRHAAERQETMNRLFLRLACLPFVVATALRCDTGNPVDLDSNGTPPDATPMASIRGSVMVDGSGISGAHVSLTRAGIARTRISAADGAFMFSDLSPGAYSLTAAVAGLTCEPASADVQAGQTATASIACVDLPRGTIAGSVTAGDTPIPGVRVYLAALGRIAITDAEGVFTIGGLPIGTYTINALPHVMTCESVSAQVEADQTVTANIVCQATGRISARIDWLDGFFPVDLAASGPVTRGVRAASGFDFDGLPAGDYVVTGTVTVLAGLAAECRSAAASVQVDQVTNVVIVCRLLRIDRSLIAGEWSFLFPREGEFGEALYEQVGDCAPLMPEHREGSIRFDSIGDGVSIVGLDPDLTIVGGYDAASHRFSGTGSAVRAEGPSIRSELTGTFRAAAYVYEGRTYFSLSLDFDLTREHRDPGGNLVCTETYTVESWTELPR